MQVRKLVGGVFVMVAVGALGGCIDNPGAFTLTNLPGSFIDINYPDGTINTSIDVGSAACDDGMDNDLDGQFDLDDPDCASSADANERLSGAQAYVASSLPINVDGAGAITFNASDLAVQARESCLAGPPDPLCMSVKVTGVGTGQTGTISAGGMTIDLPVKLEFDDAVGYTGLGASCEIGPITATYTAESYDEVTGQAMLTSLNNLVPAATNCGPWTDGINAYLGLPGTGSSFLDTTILNLSGQPIQISE